MNEQPAQEINTLKSEHLNEGERPIVASVGEEMTETYKKIPIEKALELDVVDFYGKKETLDEQGQLHGDEQTYVISPIGTNDKVSSSYYDCVGVAVVGRDKETGENISFLSHACPWSILPGRTEHENFRRDLEARLSEMKERCLPNTIDATIVGGNYTRAQKERFVRNYNSSIEVIGFITEKALGFQPVIMTGPKETEDPENVYFDTKNRRLYIDRTEVGDSTSESYLPDKIKAQEEKWRKEPRFSPPRPWKNR
jgi:hypothetical protein